MSEKYLFFNSTLEDRRKHKASDIAEYWDSFLSSGLIHVNGSPTLKVSANSTDMEVNIDLGKAVILGHLYINDSSLKKLISQSTASEDRFDRVVLRLDLGIENRYIKVFIKQGTALTPPKLTREGNIYEVSLAQIHVKAGKNYLEQSDIIDERLDEELCGLASSLVTVPTDDLMKQWYEWFDNVKKSTYITEGEFSKALGQVNMNIANLTLYQDANNRIKSGTLFGTNGGESFGNIEVDFTRSKLFAEYTAYSNRIEVEDVSGFFVGHEITIYDDINLERTRITGIDGNILEIEPLENNYAGQTNVSRTMMEYDDIGKVFKFGAFGILQDVLIDGEEIEGINVLSVLSVQDDIFYLATSTWGGTGDRYSLYRRDKFGSHTLVENLGADTGMSYGFTTDGIHVFLIYKMHNGSQKKIKAYNKNGDRLHEKILSVSPTVGNMTCHDGILYVTKYTSAAGLLYYIKYDEVDGFGDITMLGQDSVGKIFENISVISENEIVIFKLEKNMSITRYVGGVASFIRYDTGSTSLVGGVVNGEFTIVSFANDSVTIHSTSDFSRWNTSVHSILQTVTSNTIRAMIDREGTIHLSYFSGDRFYTQKKEADKPNFSNTEQMGSVIDGPLSMNYKTVTDNQKYKKPLFIFSKNDKRYLMGEITFGDGEAINTNDIRFILPPTKNIATFTASTNDVNAIGGSVNGEMLEIKNVKGQQQFVGRIPEKKPIDVRLTFTRDQTDTDSFIYKIVGGID